jgi:hypothetical protein
MSGIIEGYRGNKNQLKVKDAFKEDAGRGLVRMDPDVVQALKLKTGDVIEISHPLSEKKNSSVNISGQK